MGTINWIGKTVKFFSAVILTAFIISCSQEVNSDRGSLNSSKSLISGGIVIHFEKPSSWSEAWIWYDQDSDDSWETTTLATSPGDMTEYRTVDDMIWYKKEFESTSSVTFLFNQGDWNAKVTNSGSDFVTTQDIWVRADGSYSYTDPHGEVTSFNVYFKMPSGWGTPNIYAWVDSSTTIAGSWPGTAMTEALEEGDDWYKYTISGQSSCNLIFNDSSNQTIDLSRGSDGWFVITGTSDGKYIGTWTDSNPEGDTPPVITIDPTSQDFSSEDFTVNIAITSSNTISERTATITNGDTVSSLSLSSDTTDLNIAAYGSAGDTITLQVYAKDSEDLETTSSVQTYNYIEEETLTVYFKKPSGWGEPNIYAWVDSSTAIAGIWPGTVMSTATEIGTGWYKYIIEGYSSCNLIFNDGSNQTVDMSRSSKGYFIIDETSSGSYTGTWYDANPEDSEAPTISITNPGNGDTVTDTVAAAVTAEDNIEVVSVQYYFDGTLVGESTESPFTFLWDTTSGASKTATFKAVAYDAAGNSGTSEITVTVTNPNQVPVADAGDNRTAYNGKSISFDGSGSYDSDGSIVSYAWTDGEAGTMSGSNPSHTYYNNGTYTVTLTVTDNEGLTGYDEITVTVIDEPERTDFREETIYFLLPTRFYDGDPSNNVHSWDDVSYYGHADDEYSWQGDFYGLVQKLDYIKALGFTAIWITPPVKNASGYDYHGYHAANMKKIDPRYKTQYDSSAEEAYENLIYEVHARGMKIIQDVVYNHTSNFGEENLYPLFQKDSDGAYINLDDPDTLLANDVLELAAQNTYSKAYAELTADEQYGARIAAMKTAAVDSNLIYHHHQDMNWDTYDSQIAQIAGDCVDVNTENPTDIAYLQEAYDKWINMGVDAFRVDTVKHVSRLMWNSYFIPEIKSTGGDNFYVFGEVCSRDTNVWYRNTPPLSTPFYTWKESSTYSLGTTDLNVAAVAQHWNDNLDTSTQPTSTNHYLEGNTYHTPDWSMRSGMDVIDFPMHHNFISASGTYNTVKGGDNLYNDATWNVVYVDSHDYGPNTIEKIRYDQGTDAWAENLCLMFTWRGIPCIFYGSEIEFQKGVTIDGGESRIAINSTGRAYFGDNLEGSVTASDFGVYSASGTVASTLEYPLAKHIRDLNKIRKAIPALQKGQYSTDDVSGNMAYKKRYTSTDEGVDSFVLVTVTDGATFSNIPNGTYTDAVTGDVQTVTGGSLTISCSGQGNMRAYVLSTSLTSAPGKIASESPYLE